MREEALQTLPGLIEKFGADVLPFDHLAAAWMLCSYGQTPRKHELKKSLNTIFEREMELFHINTEHAAHPIRDGDKPHVLVVSSFFRSNHAVFRWYGPSIAHLRERFQVTGLFFTDIDPKAAALFDRCIVAKVAAVEFMSMVANAIGIARSVGADIILYPDCAMHPMSAFMANARIAPFQVLLAGHPASSYSRHMDAFAAEKPVAAKLADFSELPLLYPVGRMEWMNFPPATEREPGPVRIIVPATMPKLARPFLAVLGMIHSQIPECELHVTTHAEGEQFGSASAEIAKLIPNAKLYPRLPMDLYVHLLDQCDMFLSPFPFSGSTTINDCMVRGIPGVCMDGNELLSHQGVAQLARFGIAQNMTVAASIGEYMHKASAMARSASLRDYLRAELSRLPPQSRVMYSSPSKGLAVELERRFDERTRAQNRMLDPA